MIDKQNPETLIQAHAFNSRLDCVWTAECLFLFKALLFSPTTETRSSAPQAFTLTTPSSNDPPRYHRQLDGDYAVHPASGDPIPSATAQLILIPQLGSRWDT